MKVLVVILYLIVGVIGPALCQDVPIKNDNGHTTYFTVGGALIYPPNSAFGVNIGLLRSKNETVEPELKHRNYHFVSIGLRSQEIGAGIMIGFGRSFHTLGYSIAASYEHIFGRTSQENFLGYIRVLPAVTLNLDGKAILSAGPAFNLEQPFRGPFVGYEVGIKLVPGCF